tara:strand:+ start:2037 stop:2501 length:465 start_codon:yes stop_codon:yes gene_type:complete
MSHWTLNGNPFTEVPDKAFGFVYCITNTNTGKKYLGRKQFTSTRRKPLTKTQKKAGRVKRTVIKSDSGWGSYTGSNTLLNEDIKNIGINIFLFEILVVCYTKGQCNYIEETLQHKYNVVWDDNYYNDAVGSGKWMTVKLPESVKEQIKIIDKTL